MKMCLHILLLKNAPFGFDWIPIITYFNSPHTQKVYVRASFDTLFKRQRKKKYLLKCCNDERERERKTCKTERKMHKSDKYSGNPKTKSPTQIKSRKKNSAISCCNIQFRHFFWTFCWQSPYEIYSRKR